MKGFYLYSDNHIHNIELLFLHFSQLISKEYFRQNNNVSYIFYLTGFEKYDTIFL